MLCECCVCVCVSTERTQSEHCAYRPALVVEIDDEYFEEKGRVLKRRVARHSPARARERGRESRRKRRCGGGKLVFIIGTSGYQPLHPT